MVDSYICPHVAEKGVAGRSEQSFHHAQMVTFLNAGLQGTLPEMGWASLNH